MYRLSTACLLVTALTTALPATAHTISYSLSNAEVSVVDSGTSVTLEVRATFDAPLVASEFTVNAAGTPEAVVTGRSANQIEGNGLSYIPKTFPIPQFFNDLPHNLASQGPLREVLMDLDPSQDGVPFGTDVLVETIQVTPYGLGTLVISLSGPNAATTLGAPNGQMFASAGVDPARSTVVLEVVAPLDCSTNPPPDANHPDSDGDMVPDVCDRCPGHDDTHDADNDTVPDGCDRCPGFDDRIDVDEDGVADACDNCPNDPNPDQQDADGDTIGDACDPQIGPLFDYDQDGDVDQADFARMQACYTGETATVAQFFPDGHCNGFDVTGDGYVSARDPQNPSELMGDLGWFEKCASAPGILSDPKCGDCDGHGVLDSRTNPPDPWVINFDFDADGIQVLGRSSCIGGETSACDDNCPCVWNADQADSDGDGVGDACEPPPPITITAWRSVREHATAGEWGIDLNPTLDMSEATVEPRQGTQQSIKIDLSRAAGASSDLGGIQVIDGDLNFITPADVHFEAGNQTAVITFAGDLLQDQMCYFIDTVDVFVDPDGQPLEGDTDCAIRMLAGDVDGDGTVEADDVSSVNAAAGQPANASTVRMDIDVDGTITGPETQAGTDAYAVANLENNTVICGAGMMGMGMAFGEGMSSMLEIPMANVSASLVLHDSGATAVTLPAAGGTISIDLVITADAPIWGFEGKLAVDATDVVSINAADWTELDNVLFSNGVEGHDLASYYDLTVMDWFWVRLTPDGSDITDSGTDVEALLQPDPPTAWALTSSLAEVNDPINTPAGQWFTTTTLIGGATRELLPPGQTTLATLSLTVAGTPGTYHVMLSEGSFVDERFGAVPMSPAAGLEIIVVEP